MSSLWGMWVPTWLAAVGTVGAFGSGGVLLYREVLRDREREERAVRQRASAFAMWPERIEHATNGMASIRARLHLSNLGSEPVYDVVVEYLPPPADPVPDRIGQVPPGQHYRELPQQYGETWVPVGSGWRQQGGPTSEPVADPYREPWTFDVAVRFTDAAGVRWHRDTSGGLSQES